MNENIFDFIAASFIGIMGWFFGGLDGFVKVLLTFSVIDYFTGIAVAYVESRISSKVGFKGILKKCVMFSLVGIAHILDKHFLGDTAALRTAVVLFFVSNEGISIMENANTLGVPFPEVLRSHLEQFSKSKDDERNPEKEKQDDEKPN